MMIVTNIVAMGYLLVFHVAIQWHPSVCGQLKAEDLCERVIEPV